MSSMHAPRRPGHRNGNNTSNPLLRLLLFCDSSGKITPENRILLPDLPTSTSALNTDRIEEVTFTGGALEHSRRNACSHRCVYTSTSHALAARKYCFFLAWFCWLKSVRSTVLPWFVFLFRV